MATSTGTNKLIVKQYMGNVKKSLFTEGTRLFKEQFFPNLTSTWENSSATREILKSMTKDKNLISNVTKAISSHPAMQDINQGFKNALEDLKTGKWVNTEREDKAMESAFGFDDEFGMDFDSDISENSFNFEDTENEDGDMIEFDERTEISMDAKLNASITQKASAKSTSIISETISKSARASAGMMIQYDQAKTSANASLLNGLFSKTNESLGVLNSNLANILSFHNTVTKEYYQNSLNIMEETKRSNQDIAGYIKEMVEMERNRYQDFLNGKKSSSSESAFSQVFGFQGVNVDTLLANMKKNMMGDSGMDGGMLKMLMASPLAIPLSMALPGLFSSGTKKLFSSIDSLFGDLPKAMNYRFRNMKDQGGMQGLIGRLLYMDNTVNTRVDASKFIKGPIPFDGETKKAIVGDIAPTLRRIEAALTGQEFKNFNMDEGKFETLSETKKRYDEKTNQIFNSGFMDTKSNLRRQINTIFTDSKMADKISEEVDLVLKEIVKSNLSYDPSNSNHKLDKVDPKLQKFTNKLLLNMDARARNKFITELETNRGNANAAYKDIEENLSSHGFDVLFNGSLGANLQEKGITMKNFKIGNNPMLETLSDIRNILANGINVYRVNKGPYKYKLNPIEGLKNSFSNTNVFDSLPEVKEGIIKSQVFEDDGIWNRFDSFNKNIDSRLERASNKIEDWKYKLITGNTISSNDLDREEGVVDIVKKVAKTGIKSITAIEMAKLTKFMAKFKITEDELIKMANMYENTKNFVSTKWNNTKKIGQDFTDKAIDFLMPGFKNMTPEQKKEYTQQLKGKAVKFGKIAGGSALAGLVMGSPLIGIMGATAGFISQSDRMKNWLFGAVGEDGERTGGVISKKAQDFIKSSTKAMGIGALSGLVGGGLFFNSFGIAAPFLGAGIGMLSRSEKFQNWLFGELDEEGNRKGGVISAQTQAMFKKYAPSGLAGLLGGGLAGRLFGLGPLGAISFGMIGSGLGIAMKSEKVQSWLFGDIGEDGKRKNDGVVSKVQKYAKENMPVLGGATGGLLLGGLKYGPVGALMMGAIGAGSGMIASSESFKKWLFGDKDPETGKRKGGLLDKVSVNIKDWFKNSISAPFKEALGPLKTAFKDMTENVKGMFKAGWETFTNSIGGIFENSVGKPLKEIFEEKVGKPIKGFLTKIIMGTGKILGSILSAPIKGISGIAKALSGKDKEADKEIKASESTFDKLNIGTKLKGGLSKLTNTFSELSASMTGAFALFKNTGAKDIKTSLNSSKNRLFGKVKSAKQKMIDRIRGTFKPGGMGVSTAIAGVLATVIPSLVSSTEESSDDSEEGEQKKFKPSDIINKLTGDKVNTVKNSLKDAANKSSSVLSGVFSKIFKGGKLRPSNDITPGTLTNGTLININQYLPAIHNTLIDIKKELQENKYLKGIYKETHGQFDGLGYNVETVTNILEEHFGSPKKHAKQMEGERGNRKRKGIIGRILDFAFAPLSFLLGKPLKILKGIGGGILGSLSSVLKLPFNIIGGIFSAGKKAVDFMATLGRNIFKPFQLAFNLLGKAIGGVKDAVVGSIKLLGGMITTALQTVGSVVKETVTTIGTGIKEGFKVIGTTLTSFIPLLAQGSAALARGAWSIVKGATKGAWALGSAAFAKVLKIPLIGFRTMDVNVVNGSLDKIKVIEKIKEVETVTFTKSVGGVGRDYIKKSTKGLKLTSDDKKIIDFAGVEDKKEDEMRADIKEMAKGPFSKLFDTLGGILPKVLGALPVVLGGLASILPGAMTLFGINKAEEKGKSYRENLEKEGSITNFEKEFRDNIQEKRGFIKKGLTAIYTIKKLGNTKLGKLAVTTVKATGDLLTKILGNLLKNAKIQKLLGPLKNILSKNIGKITAKFGKLFSKNAAKNMAKKSGSKGIMKLIRTTTKSIPLAGWIIEGGFFVNDFITGFSNPNRFLNVPASVEPTGAMRLASGLGYAISSFAFEADAAFVASNEVRPAVAWLYKLFADNEEEARTAQQQEQLKADYEEFKKTHPEVSFDKFNRMQNGTHWEKIGDAITNTGTKIGRAYDKSKEFLSTAKNKIVDFGKNIWDKGIAFKDKAWEGIKNLGSSIITGIKSGFTSFIDKSISTFKGLGSEIVKMKDTLLAGLMGLPSKIGEALSNIWKGVKEKASDLKNKVVNGMKNAASFVSKGARQDAEFGMGGFVSQSSFGGIDMTIPGDSRRVSAKDVGCAPAAFTMAMNSMGYNADMKTMSQIARGYREPNDGTNYQMFSDVSSRYGIPSYTGDISSGVINDLRQGKPTILMGSSNTSRGTNNPFGKNMHYVMADHLDHNGKIRINDPLSKRSTYMDARSVFKNTKKATRFGTGILEGETRPQSDVLERIFAKVYNTVILKYTGKVKYNMSSKNPDSGKIDCSGWVQWIMAEVIRLAKMEGIKFPDTWLRDWGSLVANYGAAGITQFANGVSGLAMNKIDHKDLRPGMIIGLVTLTNKKEMARTASRPFNVSHILMVIRDKSGQIKITESRSGKGVVTSDPSRIDNEIKRGNIVYIGDPFGFMRPVPNYFEKRDSSGTSIGPGTSTTSSSSLGIVGKFWSAVLGGITGLDSIGVSVGDADPVSVTSSVERNGIDLSGVDFSKLSTKNIQFNSDSVKNKRAQYVADKMIPISKEFGQDPAIGLAQWAFESGWGSKESGKNNLFGIKATGPTNKYWKGQSSNVNTHEYINGKKMSMSDGFRSYDSIDNGIRDYYRLIRDRYPKVAKIGAKGLAGYSTTPSYISDIEKQGNKFRTLIAENLGMKFGSGINLRDLLKGDKLADSVGKVVGNAQGGLNNFLGGLIGHVDKASNSINGVTGRINTSLDNASEKINNITNIDGIKDSISGGINNVSGAITGGIDSLVNIPANVLGNLNNSVTGGIDKVVGSVSGGISSVTDTINGVLNIPNQISNSVTSAIDQTLGTITGTIKDTLGNAGVGGAIGAVEFALMIKELKNISALLVQIVHNTQIFHADKNDIRYSKLRANVGLPVDHPYDDGSTNELTKQIVKRQYI